MASPRCIRYLANLSSKPSISSRWRPALLPSRRVQPHQLTRRPTSSAAAPHPPQSLSHSLAKAIENTGPISLIHYMRQCLTGRGGGYYTSSPDQFGPQGDFVTSPEISQLFGEMLGVWIVYEWLSQGKCNGKKVALVELGPGKGTLMDDVLRTISKFKDLAECISGVHLVEASRPLREVQLSRLCGEESRSHWKEIAPSGSAKHIGAPVNWYDDVREVPVGSDEVPFFLAHEFFDALPINAFQNTPDGWRELLVDVKKSPSNLILTTSEVASQEPEFCFTVAPRQTAPARALNNLSPRYEALSTVPDAVVEMCPDSHGIMIHFCKSIHQAGGGAALIIDYGPAETIPVNSLRGIQKHTRVSPFTKPGMVDISADVDFGALVETALRPEFDIEIHGPTEQAQFLLGMGMKERCDQLAATTEDPTQLALLKSGFERLTDRGGLGMGRIYKALAVVPEADGRPVAGFMQPEVTEEAGRAESSVPEAKAEAS
ncbi:hypothetical protein DRE_03868 [Drechslerella stenobrocha 248]|uniref:Protein arginine methyltransferase NDUFAF7 n=1 Tax=Drechslerella stenobrocha 248 TaxID=1043628 RepID=W7HS03_9PEZI|nr:hypothetical protein DRE_03868 [Drechslerella stenobrocha 248]